MWSGQVYSDMDTECRKPISRWGANATTLGPVASSADAETPGPPSIIVGIEADLRVNKEWWQPVRLSTSLSLPRLFNTSVLRV